MLILLTGLTCLLKLIDAQSFLDVDVSGDTCDRFSAVLVLRCVSPLIEYTKQYSRSGPTADPRIICSLYDDYRQCAPPSVRTACIRFVQTVEAVYDYVCTGDVKTNFTRSYRCLAIQERHPKVVDCEGNVTAELRQIAVAGANSSQPEKMEMQCDAIRGYFKCVKEYFFSACGADGWNLKKEVTIRSTAAGVANCTNLEEADPTSPICNEDGSCFCRDGFVMRKEGLCEDFDECVHKPGVCSQLCENTFGSFKCICDSRYYTLAEDGVSCVREPDLNNPLSIFFAHGQSIWNVSEDGENFQLLRAGLQKAAMIDIDVQERRLYYVDIGANQMQRIRYEGAFPLTIQDYEVDGTEGLAFDWITKKLYSLRRTDMMVQEGDGKLRKTLYTNVFKLPRALVIYPHIGYLYASDWGQQSFIARSATDGSHFEKIITSGLVWPNGLAVDYYTNTLYWADAFLDIIETSALDGTNRQVILQDASSVPHVFSMVIFDDSLYWTDWTRRGIVKANKYTGENVTVIARAALLPYGIKISHPAAQPDGKNPCEDLKCSQFCLLAPNSTSVPRPAVAMGTSDGPNTQGVTGVCACVDGFDLSTNKLTCIPNCDESKTIKCAGPDPKCLSKRFYCDGVAQCLDASDEQECPQRICLQDQFQCHNGDGCLANTQVCDGIPQCKDRSDETYC